MTMLGVPRDERQLSDLQRSRLDPSLRSRMTRRARGASCPIWRSQGLLRHDVRRPSSHDLRFSMPRDPDDLFAALKRSTFRARFRLKGADATYLRDKGVDAVIEHAAKFIDDRLAPAHPANDGKQTPWRGHPVFVAQHATATCCRGCLAKWHGIAKGHELSPDERRHVLSVLRRWLEGQPVESAPFDRTSGREEGPSLFG